MVTMEALASGLCVIGTSFAIPEELKDFECCCLHDFSKVEETVSEIISLYEGFHDKKDQIAQKTVSGFGKKQYEEKFIEYTKKALEQAD